MKRNLFEQYLIHEKKEEKDASTTGPIVNRLDPPLSLQIDTEKLTVTAGWGWNSKHKHTYQAKTLKQAWWHWYNPWKGFMGDYDKQARKEGLRIDYSK